ncbi:carboxylic ester hydrolase [Streptomyces mashuensis]|uniref:Carboxylic ester hydrolase n=1 Tax=Streptomyces mashuensis TaxID=33904 RepID=A0A919B7K8_9ACTN|nr:carboxylesterase family protein [Streptomyces mashuensis]GHF67244.1 carboxylic ester hydrolase [Streptomyces mashuensis]
MATPRRLLAPLLLTVVALLGTAVPVAAREDPAVVTTDRGAIRGVVTDGGRAFLGVPFAAPPVGALRWRPPGPAAPWPGVRDATRAAGPCAQPARPLLGTSESTNEDCLYLNVHTPPGGGTGRPVLVWFHGGSFVSGSAAHYDPSRLARAGDMVVVTANYRLGAFGYLAHPGLGAEAPDTGSGNYGLMDQQAALRWVGDNAAAFGGDPGRVTVGGQSSGGLSVCDHLVSPLSRGLFARALVQSAPCQVAARPLARAESTGTGFATGAGCLGSAPAVVACLRAKSAADLLKVPVTGAAPWWPVSGTPVLPVPPGEAIAAGDYATVPVLTGNTLDEGTIGSVMVESSGVGLNAVTYPLVLTALFGTDGPRIAARYPASRYGGDHRLAFAAAFGDYLVACPARETAQWFAATTPGRVFGYEFADRNAPVLYASPPGFPLGAYHGSEIPYLFGYRGTGAEVHLDPAQTRLAEAMTAAWARFAGGADPAPGTWPPVTTGPYRPLSLAPDAIAPRTGFEAGHQCDFWATVPPPTSQGPTATDLILPPLRTGDRR